MRTRTFELPQEPVEAREAVGSPVVDGVLFDFTFKAVGVFEAQTVGIDQEAEDVDLRAVMQPRAVVQPREGLRDGLVQALGGIERRAFGVFRRRTALCLGLLATGLAMRLPVCLLAFSRAVLRGRTLGTAFEFGLGLGLVTCLA